MYNQPQNIVVHVKRQGCLSSALENLWKTFLILAALAIALTAIHYGTKDVKDPTQSETAPANN